MHVTSRVGFFSRLIFGLAAFWLVCATGPQAGAYPNWPDELEIRISWGDTVNGVDPCGTDTGQNGFTVTGKLKKNWPLGDGQGYQATELNVVFNRLNERYAGSCYGLNLCRGLVYRQSGAGSKIIPGAWNYDLMLAVGAYAKEICGRAVQGLGGTSCGENTPGVCELRLDFTVPVLETQGPCGDPLDPHRYEDSVFLIITSTLNPQTFSSTGSYQWHSCVLNSRIVSEHVADCCGGPLFDPPEHCAIAGSDRVHTVRWAIGPSLMSGHYQGLATSTGEPAEGGSGSVDLTVDKDLGFKGKLTACGVTYLISGQFDTNGQWNAQSPLPIALQLDSFSGQITGTVAGASCAATIMADRQVYDKKGNPAPWAGYYTMAMLPAGASGPQGAGWVTAKVDAGGAVNLKGVLGDGTPITQKTTVSQDGQIPVYVPLYGNQGALSGWITITNQTSGSCTGNLVWVKLAKATDKYYPGGFAVPVTLQGGKYIPPATGTRVLNLANTTGNARVSLSGGDLASVQQNTVTVSAANTVTVVSGTSQKLTVKITPKTGLFSGSFIHPATGKPAKFSGVIVQTSNEGRGYFLGTTQAGSVLIQSAP